MLKASTIVLRGTEHAQEGQVELHGSVTNFVSVSNFRVRDVAVDATGIALDAASCGTVQLGNDLQVEVTGVLKASGEVTASAISCEKAGDANTVTTRVGAAAKVDTAAKTFSLTTTKETLSVQWGDLALFRNVEAASLDGKQVEVEGITSAAVRRALKIAAEQD